MLPFPPLNNASPALFHEVAGELLREASPLLLLGECAIESSSASTSALTHSCPSTTLSSLPLSSTGEASSFENRATAGASTETLAETSKKLSAAGALFSPYAPSSLLLSAALPPFNNASPALVHEVAGSAVERGQLSAAAWGVPALTHLF